MCHTDKIIRNLVVLLFFYHIISVCSILAEVTFTQAKGKMWFLSYHWELPILAGPDEIHPGTLAELAEIT